MYCSNCGKKIDEKASFCSECGTPVKSSKKKKNRISIDYSKSVLIGILASFIVCIGLFHYIKNNPDKADTFQNKLDQTEIAENIENTPNTEDIQEDDLVDKNDSNGELEQKENSDDNIREEIFPYEKDGYIVFGAYEQDGDESNGPEPIEWEVLGEDENGLLLVSRYILDCHQYNITLEDVTWKTCTLRYWLNGTFLETAFTASEQELIKTTNVINLDNPYSGANGGDTTEDKIFCLSADEVINHYSFNIFCDGYYFGVSQQLIVPATQYAIDNGVECIDITETDYNDKYISYGYNEKCIGQGGGCWWLRTPCETNDGACNVSYDGTGGAIYYYWFVTANSVGVRPALYLNNTDIDYKQDGETNFSVLGDNSYLPQYASLLREYLYSTDDYVGIYTGFYDFTSSKDLPNDYKGVFALVDIDGDGKEELLVSEYGYYWNVIIPGECWIDSLVGNITTYDPETRICTLYTLDGIEKELKLFENWRLIYLTPDDPEYYIDCQEIWVTDYYEITEENITQYCGE